MVGREEIDKFGDATVGEVLRRLPGVTTPGAPGRGGPPRMRGLGGGFTQILIDGQRLPPGYSLDSLTPEQIERIEILRAPTAETGARAIAGTINIITREGYRVRLNDLRLGAGFENGQWSPGLNWSHNDSAGPLTYTLSASVFSPKRESTGRSENTVQDATTGELLEARSGTSTSLEKRIGTNLNARLQWRLNELGDSLALMPSILYTEASSDNRFDVLQTLRRASTPPYYDNGTTRTDSRFVNARLGSMWRQRVGDVRLEVNGNGGIWRSNNESLRNEYATGVINPLRTFDDRTSTRESSVNLTIKGSGITGGGAPGGVAGGAPGAPPAAPAPAAEHNLVSGAEIEAISRSETRISVPDLADFDDNLKSSSLRLAAYVQDEWQLNPNWGVHAGLRWEGITTRGDTGLGERPTNRSSVWTPLLHAVWRPDPKSRDQVRISLTRSYRSPQLGALMGRPSVNRDYPALRANTETAADNAGNPDLKPELATGIDLAIERYMEGGGVLSANLFHRSISNLIRGQVQLETVPWSPVQRFVRRQRNIGDASTTGIELEAKFRLDQLVTDAPRVELRGNLSLYNSQVKGVPGPNNRLDQQAKATANVGADYRIRGLPLTLGGNVNWVPGYTTQIDAEQAVTITSKRVWDAFALWTFTPAVGLRLLGSNLDPREYLSTTTTDASYAKPSPDQRAFERSTSRSFSPNYINWQLRLELKL